MTEYNNTNTIDTIINTSNTNLNTSNNNNLSISDEYNLNSSRIQQKKINLENIIKNTTISPSINSLKSVIKEKILYGNVCEKHNSDFVKFCKNCKIDICSFCEMELHKGHEFLNYEKILPDLEDISNFKKNFESYEEVYKIFYELINKWKNEIDTLYNKFNNEINNIFEFITKFSSNKFNFNSIFKYRNIYKLVSEDRNEKNEKIIELMKKYYEDDDIINKITKDFELFPPFNNLKRELFLLNNNNCFIDKSKKIISILLKNDYKDLNNSKSTQKQRIINLKNGIFSLCPKKNLKNSIFSNKTNTTDSTTSRNNTILNKLINKTMTDNNNNILNEFNIINKNNFKPNEKEKESKIYSKKAIHGKSFENKLRRSKITFPSLKDQNNYSLLHDKRNQIILNCEDENNNKNSKLQKSINKITINNLIKKIDRNSNCNNKNYIIFQKRTQSEKYLHEYKNFDQSNEDSEPELLNTFSNKFTSIKYTPVRVKTNSLENKPMLKLYDTMTKINKYYSYSIDNKNIKNNKNQIYIPSNSINKSITENNITKKNFLNKSSIYNEKNKRIYIHKKFTSIENVKNNLSIKSNENNNSNTDIISSIIKNSNNDEIYIKNNEILNIGLELDNTACKLAIASSENNIKLFNINSNFSIPTIIYFDDSGMVQIGNSAEEFRISKPSQTFYNLVKLLGVHFDEISGRKNLWSFKLYNDSQNNLPYVKVKTNNNDNNFKNYYIEDLLVIYLKKLFDLFFSKIIIDCDNNTNNTFWEYKILDINLIITVPNYYSYFQRNILTKIFENIIFPKNTNNNSEQIIKIYSKKYIIQLNNIKIENATNLPIFCITNTNKDFYHIKPNNYLILSIDDSSINTSVISCVTNKNKPSLFEVKSINGILFDEDDFIDNFIYDCLYDFEESIRNNCLNSPVALAKLRKSFEIVKNLFFKNTIQTEININKIYGNVDLKMSINKSDYDNLFINIIKKIILFIKETIKNSQIKTKDFNDIILIGDVTKNQKFKELLISEIFNDNKNISKKILSLENKNENLYIIIGSLLHSIKCNINIKFPKIKLKEICVSSFGVESLKGAMNFVIERGNMIPIKTNKFIKIEKNNLSSVKINIYEGENVIAKNNKMISNCCLDINHFKDEKFEEGYIEILFQFCIGMDNKLSVFILDKNTYIRKFECIVNENY